MFGRKKHSGKASVQTVASVAFNLIFRAEDRTLTDDECNNAVKKAIAAAEKLGAELRS